MIRPDRRTGRLPAVLVAGAAAALLLAGCGGAASAGSAAVLGDSRVTTEEVAAQVAAVHRANNQPVDQVDESLTRATVERLTTDNLVSQAAERLGIVVPQGAIDEALAGYEAQLGGRENVEQAFLKSGVPAEAIESTVALSLKAEAIGRTLVPNGTPEEQQRAVYDAIVALSDELGVTVSPRFGTWDPEQLQVGPRPTDVSVPAIDAEGAVVPSGEPAPAETPSPQAP